MSEASMTKEDANHVFGVPPTIEVFEKNGQWVFYCPHCDKEHFHAPGEGHRMAHCMDLDSPFFDVGYYLVLKDA